MSGTNIVSDTGNSKIGNVSSQKRHWNNHAYRGNNNTMGLDATRETECY